MPRSAHPQLNDFNRVVRDKVNRDETRVLATRYIEAHVNADAETGCHIETVAGTTELLRQLAHLLAVTWATAAMNTGMSPRAFLNAIIDDATQATLGRE
jgi:hypothetical protein